MVRYWVIQVIVNGAIVDIENIYGTKYNTIVPTDKIIFTYVLNFSPINETNNNTKVTFTNLYKYPKQYPIHQILQMADNK